MTMLKTLALLLLLMLAAPAAAQAPNYTSADLFTPNVEVKAEAEFKATHAAAVEMRRLRVEAVELRRLASALAARRLSARR